MEIDERNNYVVTNGKFKEFNNRYAFAWVESAQLLIYNVQNPLNKNQDDIFIYQF